MQMLMLFVFLFKVGTAVVTRKDGRLAVGKVGTLCEQVSRNGVQRLTCHGL